jgi:hypothetical protein
MAVEALIELLLAKVSLQLIPFRRLAGRLGAALPAGEGVVRLAAEPVSAEAAGLAADVRWAVIGMAHYAPFKAVCLPQALAAKSMLRRRGVASLLHLGVARDPDQAAKLEAHAWLQAAGVKVTGYPIAHRFTEVASFL